MCTCTLYNDAWECVRGTGLEAINIFTVCFGRKEEWEGREGDRGREREREVDRLAQQTETTQQLMEVK